MENDRNIEIGWDDEIKQGEEFVTLPEGDYDFTILSFSRVQFDGSDKMPACKKASLKIKIETEQGVTLITHQIPMLKTYENQLAQLFKGIDYSNHDKEVIRMNWSIVPGATGRAHVYVDKYTKNNKEYETNRIKKIYPKEAPSENSSGGTWQWN